MAKRTALYDRHVALGGRMVEYAGWMLPVQYPMGPKEEHLRVRAAAGLFDIDHMGQVVVKGADAMPFLQRMMTADVSTFEVWSAHYALMCYDDGGVVDDTFIYRLPDRYLVVVNAANNAKDTRWLEYHRSGFDVTVENVSEETYMLALQGPRAEAILSPLLTQPRAGSEVRAAREPGVADLSELAFHTAMETVVAGVPALVGRTGYTGEDGFELFFAAEHAGQVWDRIMESGEPHGLLPIGLAARDSLRFEPCLPLYGQEITAMVDPMEAGLGWAVALDKGPFVGREALLKTRLEGVPNRLVGLRMTARGVPRHGYEVLAGNLVVGEVTSGMYAPAVDAFLALAYLPVEYSAPGTKLGVMIRDRIRPAVVVRKPFYTPTYRR
jgi:aminomethyltransferase